ncbi:unnamed protein product [Rotaria sp. Silwood2]|nr:unnamed protein product [Rotaria sp. Silwood2]
MTQLFDQKIDYFQFAAEAFLINAEHLNNQSNTLTGLQSNSREGDLRHKLSDESRAEPDIFSQNHQEQASNHLLNTSSHPETANNFNQTTSTSNTELFDDPVNQLFSTNVNTTSPIFSDINQLDHNKKQLLEYINSHIIGKNLRVNTPWGSRKVIYADYTASGRGLIFIEYYMLNKVLPYYANTHSENAACALQTTKFREGA